MKNLLVLIISLLILSSCGKDCETGKFSFYGHCLPTDGRVYYFGKTAFYCFPDSLAIGVDVTDKSIQPLYAEASGIQGGVGVFNYTDRKYFSRACDTEEYGESNTFVVFEDVDIESLPPSFEAKLYHKDWNIPFEFYDSTTIVMVRR